MGCSNDLDEKTLLAARSQNDAKSGLRDAGAQKALAKVASAARASVDRRGDRAILKARKGEKPSPADFGRIGDIAEAGIARHLVEKLGHAVTHINTKPGEKGLDLITVDLDEGSLYVWEVKSSTVEGSVSSPPSMSTLKSGAKQLSKDWIEPRLEKAGLDNVTSTDVQVRAVKVDLSSGKAQVWIVDPLTGSKIRSGSPVDVNDLLDLRG